jgi:hypothetical protein
VRLLPALVGITIAACGSNLTNTSGDAGTHDLGTADTASVDADADARDAAAGSGVDALLCACGSDFSTSHPTTCSFPAPCAEGDFFRLHVRVDGAEIPSDAWDYEDQTMLSLLIMGDTCTAIMNGTVADVTISYGCATP